MPESKSKLPKFADWTPPWGDDPESIDADKLAPYIHGLLSDKEKLQGKVDVANAKVTEVTSELEQARKALTEADAKGADEKLTAATAKVTELETKLKAAESTALKYEVALDEGLTKVQAKRLVGNTAEELKADAEELLESFGGAGRKSGDEEDDDDAGLKRTPKGLVNGVDRGGDATDELDDKAILSLVGGMPRGSFI